jgi:hypothetical protein
MTRYLEQTQSTAIAKLLSRVGFSRPPWLWFLHLRHAGVPISSPVLPSNQPLAVHRQALAARLAFASLLAAFQDGLGGRRKSGDGDFGPPTGEF